jgi:hypothetical protein
LGELHELNDGAGALWCGFAGLANAHWKPVAGPADLKAKLAEPAFREIVCWVMLVFGTARSLNVVVAGVGSNPAASRARTMNV